jgi:hypothetical protein
MDLTRLQKVWENAQDQKSRLDPDSLVIEVLNQFISEKLVYNEWGNLDVLPDEPPEIALPDTLLDELNLNGDQFIETFIQPWSERSVSELEKIIALWNQAMGVSYHLRLELHQQNGLEALRWTVVNVMALFLKTSLVPDRKVTFANSPLEILFPGKAYARPFHQCHLCGRLEEDPRGVKFGKLKFCHLRDCPASDSDYNAHEHQCCYREWRRLSKLFHIQWKNYQKDPQKQKMVLLKFCNERFKTNSKNARPLRSQKRL